MTPETDALMYPPIKPYRTGFLPVGNGHEIYWEECGNPDGFPVFFIHGGPGAGCDEDDRRFFNPDKWRIIIHDQRGCNRSKAQDKLEANNTWALVDDIYRLRQNLGIDRFVLFGGSWGSTLALVYTSFYPREVAGMILRGIFLATKREMDYFYKDGFNGIGIYIPEQWQRYISFVPLEYRNNPLAYYLQEIKKGNKKMARELARFECSNLHRTPPAVKDLEEDLDGSPDMALIEAHYFTNNCFLEDGYILNSIWGLINIPTTIIHGAYDLICMPLSAYSVHNALLSSSLHWTDAGHSSRDPETLKKLISETDAMFDKVSK